MSDTLAIVPTYLRTKEDWIMTARCLESLRATAPDCEILVVDDGSPNEELVWGMSEDYPGLGYHTIIKEENSGFAATVNVGLKQAREAGQNVVLVNADVEFFDKGWLDRCRRSDHSVVGGLLLYPNGLIQHAGIFYSVIAHTFDHIYRLGPGSLDLAQVERICPVTGALQFIRHETLQNVGIYDENFKMGYEDVSYCHEVFDSGRKCVYDPTVRAIHHENYFRKRMDPKLEKWTSMSRQYLFEKHAGRAFDYVPTLIPELDDA